MDFMRIMHAFGSGGRSDAPLPAGSVATTNHLICKYCKGTKFYSGPEGCGSTNILCANPECRRHWFCDIGIPGQPLMDLKRVEPTESEQEAISARRKTIELGRRALVALEGFDAHKIGGRAFSVLSNEAYGGAAHRDNLDRLAGYIDSMNGHPRWMLEGVAQTGYAAQTEEDALKADAKTKDQCT